MASIWTLHFHSQPFQPSICVLKHRISSNVAELRTELGLNCIQLNWNRQKLNRSFVVRATSNVDDDDRRIQEEAVETAKGVVVSKNPFGRLQETIGSFPTVAIMMKRYNGSYFTVGICIAMTILVISIRVYVVNKASQRRPGSVADLVRRGQLRSDRRGITRPLKYEDPFNNPLVKVGKSNSTVEMCGKVYRLAPVTLTEEQQTIHQRRRSRAYQWKRPTMFLKEGDPVPPDVDPDTIRWIPSNHPFASTATDIDENMAQNNVYQKHGVPFRIRAEHEALQKKLEALQSDQKLNKLMIDPSNVKDFERPFKTNSRSYESEEQNPLNSQLGNSKPPKSNGAPKSAGSNSSSEEMKKP